ncbi:hypothetical protein V8E51_004184 [Hyaloscypha variabilis]
MPLKRSSQSLTAVCRPTCRVCGKSGDKEASIKSHERYCRKRIAYPAPPRRKSCIACIRAKSRCDLSTPACGPCQRKARICLYSSESLSPEEEQSHLSPKRQSAKTELVSKLVSQIICSFPERKMSEDSRPPFIHHSLFRRSARTTTPISEDPIIICQKITRKFTAREAYGDPSVWNAIAFEQERLYDQRGSLDKWLHLSSAQALTIYLLMLAGQRESVLANHPNLGITLLFTLGANFEKLNQIHPGFITAKEQSRDRPTWEDWIFAESKLRTATVYFILALQFDVQFGLPCHRESDDELEDVDLPASKTLWEAKNELSWHETRPVRTSEARLNYGDLVRHNKQLCGYEHPDIQIDDSRLANRVDRWQKEMDEFGMLVSLCGTML